MKRKDLQDWVYYLIILLGVALFWIPFMFKGFTQGAELEFHYARVMTLADSIKAGVFPAKIMPTHMRGFGYGIGFFYPNLFIYPPALAIAMGMGYDLAIKSYLFVMTFIGGVVSFRCFKEVSGSSKIALIGEILLMGTVLNDHNLFNGGGIPHLFSYLFLSLAFCGLIRVFQNIKSGYVEYAIGIALVLLSHNMIFLTMFFVMAIILVVHGKVIAKNIGILGKLVLVSLIAMVATTAYWLPAMEQIKHVPFKCFYGNAYTVTDHILTFKELVFENVGIHYFVLFVICGLIYVALFYKRKSMPVDITSIFCTIVLTIWLMCSKLVWTSAVGKALNFFEYTSRFEFVLMALIALMAVLTMREIYAWHGEFSWEQKAWSGTAFAAICVILILITRFAARPDFFSGENRVEFSYEIIENTWPVSFGEWLPVNCEPSECKEPETARASDKSSAEGTKAEFDKSFDVWLLLDQEYYDMPYVYYYGYRAYLLDEVGSVEQELDTGYAADDNGYLRVYMPENMDGIGHVLVTYRKTMIQKVSYVVSLVTILGLFVMTCVGLFKKKERIAREYNT